MVARKVYEYWEDQERRNNYLIVFILQHEKGKTILVF